MSSIKTLSTTESSLASARGLMEIVHFVFDHARPEDWHDIRTPFGFLLNAVTGQLDGAGSGVAHLYREHFTANDQGRQH